MFKTFASMGKDFPLDRNAKSVPSRGVIRIIYRKEEKMGTL